MPHELGHNSQLYTFHTQIPPPSAQNSKIHRLVAGHVMEGELGTKARLPRCPHLRRRGNFKVHLCVRSRAGEEIGGQKHWQRPTPISPTDRRPGTRRFLSQINFTEKRRSTKDRIIALGYPKLRKSLQFSLRRTLTINVQCSIFGKVVPKKKKKKNHEPLVAEIESITAHFVLGSRSLTPSCSCQI